MCKSRCGPPGSRLGRSICAGEGVVAQTKKLMRVFSRQHVFHVRVLGGRWGSASAAVLQILIAVIAPRNRGVRRPSQGTHFVITVLGWVFGTRAAAQGRHIWPVDSAQVYICVETLNFDMCIGSSRCHKVVQCLWSMQHGRDSCTVSVQEQQTLDSIHSHSTGAYNSGQPLRS